VVKQSGIGVRLYAAGYDLSTDVSAISNISAQQELLDTTALATDARTRIIGLNDARIAVNGWFDAASGRSHAAWTSNSGKLPTADQIVLVTYGTSRGDAFSGLDCKQADYNVSRTPGSAVATTVNYEGTAGAGVENGVLLTTGTTQTDSSATTSASVDEGSAASGSAPAAYLEVISLASGEATIVVQDSGNDVSWSTKATFTSVTGRTAERVTASGSSGRYLRVVTSGTFSNLVFVVGFSRG
jgi:hypothetical protein